MRSSASAGLFGAGSGFDLGGQRRRSCAAATERSSSSFRVALRAVDRQRDHRPAQHVGIVLVDFGGEHMGAEQPVARRDRHRHVEQRREILPHIELGVLAADEHRDLAGALRRLRLGGRRRAGAPDPSSHRGGGAQIALALAGSAALAFGGLRLALACGLRRVPSLGRFVGLGLSSALAASSTASPRPDLGSQTVSSASRSARPASAVGVELSSAFAASLPLSASVDRRSPKACRAAVRPTCSPVDARRPRRHGHGRMRGSGPGRRARGVGIAWPTVDRSSSFTSDS